MALDLTEILYRAAHEAKIAVVNETEHTPHSLLHVKDRVHHFNHLFMETQDAEASSMFLKAACRLLSPDYVVSVAVVKMALPAQQWETLVGQISTDPQEALLVVLRMPGGAVRVYLSKVLRDGASVVCGFSEIVGLDADELAQRLPDPFSVPDSGLPLWLLNRVGALLGVGVGAIDHCDAPPGASAPEGSALH